MANQVVGELAVTPGRIEQFRDITFERWMEGVPEIHQALLDANISAEAWPRVASDQVKQAYEQRQADMLREVERQPQACYDSHTGLTDAALHYQKAEQAVKDSVATGGGTPPHAPDFKAVSAQPLPPDIQSMMKKAEAAGFPIKPPPGSQWLKDTCDWLQKFLSLIGLGEPFQKLRDKIDENYRDHSIFDYAAEKHDQVVKICDRQNSHLEDGMQAVAAHWIGVAGTAATSTLQTRHQVPMNEVRAQAVQQGALLRHAAYAQEQTNWASVIAVALLKFAVIAFVGFIGIGLIVVASELGCAAFLWGLIVLFVDYLIGVWMDLWSGFWE